MMLTTKGRYAVMALVELALTSSNEPITLQELSNKQNIPLNYLEQIFAKLRKEGLVTSIRGPKGGYIIEHSLDDINIAHIIDAVEENIKMTRCGTEGNCTKDNSKCQTHHVWKGLSRQIRTYLESITIADIIGNQVVSQKIELPKNPVQVQV